MKHMGVLVYLPMLLLFIAASPRAFEIPQPQPTDAFSAEVAVAWFDLLYDVVKAERVGPPPASRMYGISAVALYEAVVTGSLGHVSLVGQLNELTSVPRPRPFREYHWPTVANRALAQTVRGLFPNASPTSHRAIAALEHQFSEHFRASVRPLVSARSVVYGQAVAEAVLAWAGSDGSALLNNCPYTPPVGPGFWEPTPPDFTPNPAQACWGQLRPFILTSGAGLCATPSPRLL